MDATRQRAVRAMYASVNVILVQSLSILLLCRAMSALQVGGYLLAEKTFMNKIGGELSLMSKGSASAHLEYML